VISKPTTTTTLGNSDANRKDSMQSFELIGFFFFFFLLLVLLLSDVLCVSVCVFCGWIFFSPLLLVCVWGVFMWNLLDVLYVTFVDFFSIFCV
jgi:hypothetical protein